MKYLFLFIVIFSMIYYQTIILTTKGKMSPDGDIIEPPTSFDSFLGNIYTAVYSAVVITFGTLYKILANV